MLAINCLIISFSDLDKPISITNKVTIKKDIKPTAVTRKKVSVILLCIRKTKNDENNVITNAGKRNDFIYSRKLNGL